MLKTLGLAVCVAAAGFASKKPVDNEHFLIHGSVYEIDPVQNTQNEATNTRVIVYAEGEIYVAFNTNESGEYIFNLPVGQNYVLEYGGEDYVNKRISINASRLDVEKRGKDLDLDMGLFRFHPGVDYGFLNEPVAKFEYRQDEGFVANDVYSQKMARQTMKTLDSIRSLHE